MGETASESDYPASQKGNVNQSSCATSRNAFCFVFTRTMSKSSQAANSVIKACEDVCALYRVPCFRMQSRVFTVRGAKGRERPMFAGQWRDGDGVLHTSGMADLLAMPRINFVMKQSDGITHNSRLFHLATVPLWIECKSGTGKLSPDQQAFKSYVEASGAYFLEVRDSADQLLEWFKAHGCTR
jgi:hypothetical protein